MAKGRRRGKQPTTGSIPGGSSIPGGGSSGGRSPAGGTTGSWHSRRRAGSAPRRTSAREPLSPILRATALLLGVGVQLRRRLRGQRLARGRAGRGTRRREGGSLTEKRRGAGEGRERRVEVQLSSRRIVRKGGDESGRIGSAYSAHWQTYEACSSYLDRQLAQLAAAT